jgi:hypothetical protein
MVLILSLPTCKFVPLHCQLSVLATKKGCKNLEIEANTSIILFKIQHTEGTVRLYGNADFEIPFL